MKAPTGRKPYTPERVLREIRRLHYKEKFGPYAIWQALCKQQDEAYRRRKEWLADKVPHYNTIKTYVRSLPELPDADPWVLAGAPAEEAELLLPIVQHLMYYTGRVALTQGEARWLLWVARLAPGLGAGHALDLASEYLIREAQESSTEDLDAVISLQPWREDGDWNRRYWAWVRRYYPDWEKRIIERAEDGRITSGSIPQVAGVDIALACSQRDGQALTAGTLRRHPKFDETLVDHGDEGEPAFEAGSNLAAVEGADGSAQV